MPLALRFALRELRSGIAGFRVFLACLALGVASLAATGSVASAFRHGLAAQSRSILGGDLAVSLHGNRFTPTQRALFDRLGRTSDEIHVRAMAEGPTGLRHLVELRGVDAAYPLAGTVQLANGATLPTTLAPATTPPAAAVDAAALDRLKIPLGATFHIGDRAFVARARLLSTPDALSHGFALGPQILISRDALETSGLIEADSLFGEHLLIALDPDTPLARATDLIRTATDGLARIQDRTDAAGGLRRAIDQSQFFLGFLGLASLLACGLGVSTAVRAHLATRIRSIAILKALGARGATIRDIYLLQIAFLAVLGIAIGLAIGAATPIVLGRALGHLLPIPADFGLYPDPLARAAAFGALAAAAFGLGPIAQARATPPAALYRRDATAPPRLDPERAAQFAALLGLAALAIATAPSAAIACGMIAAILVAFGILAALARAAIALARRLRTRTRGALRLGLASLAGPGSAARLASPAIGIAVALVTTVLLIEASLTAAITRSAPRAAPSLILTGIAADDAQGVETLLETAMGKLTPDRVRLLPLLTGRITALHHAPIDPKAIASRERWAYDADIGMTALGPAPPDADLTAGAWWPQDYAGPPEIVLDRDIARAAGLRVADPVTLQILGRSLDTRIAALRRTDFGRFGTSFPLILDPHALTGARLRDLVLARTTAAQDRTITAALGARYPDVNVISLREQLARVASIFAQLAAAARACASVTGLAGLLVLIGAVSSTAEARAREAAILKTLGANSRQLLAIGLVEYASVGLIASAAGIVLGAAAAWPVAAFALHAPLALPAAGLALVFAACVTLSAGAGLVGALVAIARPPAPMLRLART